MFNLSKNTNMNEIITLEEAEQILQMAKRLYPGMLDNVFVQYDNNGYAYCRNFATGERHISIFEFPNNELEEISKRIMAHVNKEFNANFAMNLKTITIHAFCHEIGHAIDFEMQKALGNYDYEDKTEVEYALFYRKADLYYAELDDLEDYMHEYDIEEDDEGFLERWKEEVKQMGQELDYQYRMITTEYAADKFSTEFMETHLRHVKQLFNSEGMMTVENETIKTYGWKYNSKLCYNVRS